MVSPELVTPTLDAAKPPDADDADAEVWELARKDMLLGNVLGVGHFGKVCMAKLRVPWGGEIDVAVKMAKADRMTSQAFLGEASKLKKLQHRNIVRVYGLCTYNDFDINLTHLRSVAPTKPSFAVPYRVVCIADSDSRCCCAHLPCFRLCCVRIGATRHQRGPHLHRL